MTITEFISAENISKENTFENCTPIKRIGLNTDGVESTKHRLDGVVIENKDFENHIKVYDREKALFCCDPPYHKTKRHYSVKFAEADHERLCTLLHEIKGRFILSYNDDDYIRTLYALSLIHI